MSIAIALPYKLGDVTENASDHPREQQPDKSDEEAVSPSVQSHTSTSGLHIDRGIAIQNLEDRMRRAEKWMIWLTAAIAFFGLCSVIVAFLQWRASENQGVDTHSLAQAAGQQAQAADDMATAAGDQVDAANNFADTAEEINKGVSGAVGQLSKQLSLYAKSQTPFLFLKDMPQSAEDYGDDTLIKWSQVWRNSGGTTPLGLTIWMDCHDADTGQPLNFYRRRSEGMTAVIGPQSDRVIGGCETSYSSLKRLDDENLERAKSANSNRTNMYVFGGAHYQDFLGTSHEIEYCYQLYWDNRHIKVGFHLIQCLPPNDGHYCTDQECRKESPKSS